MSDELTEKTPADVQVEHAPPPAAEEMRAERLRQTTGLLNRAIDDVRLTFALLRDWLTRRYRHTPWRLLAAAVMGLLYVLVPTDLMPDLVPIVGVLDDLTVALICIAVGEKDLLAYQQWRLRGGTDDVAEPEP